MNKLCCFLTLNFIIFNCNVFSQTNNSNIAQAISNNNSSKEIGYDPIISNTTEEFTFFTEKFLNTTPVKDQNKTNTCWCFSSISFIETELLKNGAGEFNLSPMSIVRQTYIAKARQYVRMHGEVNFAGGGCNHDAIDVMKTNGVYPQEIYSGLKTGEFKYNHYKMDSSLLKYVEKVVESKKLDTQWMSGFEKIMNDYMGVPPDSFLYQGNFYTPKTFLNKLAINLDDYVVFTSFTHHPFYEKFVLEVPDNWKFSEVYNVPLNELMEIIDQSIVNDHSVAWSADITENGFVYKKGLAVLPDVDELNSKNTDWQDILKRPGKETNATQEIRQKEFDDFSTTDDHGMQIVGIAKDQTGKKYYYVKNSWGTSNKFNGYIYASENYVKLKTTSVMINKNALPLSIRRKFTDLN